MSTLKDDVTELINTESDSFSTITNQFFHEDLDTETEEMFSEKGITFENQDSYGGEGQGDSYWSVYKFTRGDESVYVQFDGWYQSYNGSEFTEWFFVEPKEVTVTQFHRVK